MIRPWVAIQRNPVSGSGRRRGVLMDLIAHLRNHGFVPRLYSRRERLTQRLADPGWREKLVSIVAAGGDGTVGDVINRYPDLPVAILPLGTENLLARYLRIPKSGQAVADMIAGQHTRRFDLGVIGERRFSLMASFGFDADVVHRAHARRAGHITRFSYVQPICQSLRKYTYPEMRVHIDGSTTPVQARLVVVANLPVYALRLPVAASAAEDNGLLDLRLFRRGSTFQMMRYFYKVALGKHEGLEDVQIVQAKRIRVDSDEPVAIQVDGDPAGRTPAEVYVLPQALELFVPGGQRKI